MGSKENKEEKKLEDLLRFEGIECKGFGILPKFVMRDLKLSIGAKGLYAYYCSLAGAEIITFPRRETILTHLKINKETFYKYQNELLQEGYISVKQEKNSTNHFGKNIYTLIQNPKKLQEYESEKNFSQDEFSIQDVAYFSGLKSYGYGIIPRIVMQDPRLGIKEKAVYAYYVVYSGAGKESYLCRDLILFHLNISKNSYMKYMQSLILCDYIHVKQCVTAAGRFSTNTYILNSMPVSKRESSNIPCPKKPDTEKSAVPCPKKPDTERSAVPCPKKPDTEKSAVPCPKKPDTERSAVPCPKKPDTEKSAVPCPKKPDTEKSAVPCPKIPYPKIPYPKKPDTTNNSNIYTNNSNINQSISINKQLKKWMDGKIESLELPESPLNEVDAEVILDLLLDKKNKKYTSELKQSAFEVFYDALLEMCISTDEIKLKDSQVTYIKVIRKINRLLTGKNFLDAYVTFDQIVDSVLVRFLDAMTEPGRIKDPFKYMKACIWSSLLTEEMKFQADIIHFKLVK